MNKLRPTIFLLFLSIQLFAQEKDTSSFFENSHFKIVLNNGMTFTTFKSEVGTATPLVRPNYFHALNINNTYNFSEYWGLNTSAEVGFLGFNYDVPTQGIYQGTEDWGYGWKTWYNIYAKVAIGAQFHKTISKKSFLFADLNLGWTINNTYGYGSSAVNQNLTIFEFNMQRQQTINPFLSFNVGYNRQIKNQDFIGFSLFGQVAAHNTLKGTYSLYDNSASGHMINKGSNFGVGLHYLFSQIRKKEFIDDLVLSDLDDKEKKKFVKKEKRFVHPKSIFVGVRGGIFSGKTMYPQPSPLKNAGNPSWMAGVQAEFGLKKHIYLTTSISVQEFWESISFRNAGGSFSSSFTSTSLSAGLSKHLYSRKKNTNIINFDVGFSTGVHFDQLGPTGFGSGGSTFNGSFLEYQAISTNTRRLYGTIYGGINRDFQISKNLFFNFSYRYDIGMWAASTIDVQIWTDPNQTVPQEFQGKINGTSHSTQFGLRYKFLK